jgi:hypothetical protein
MNWCRVAAAWLRLKLQRARAEGQSVVTLPVRLEIIGGSEDGGAS